MLSQFLNTNLPNPSLSGHTTNLFSHNTQLASHSLLAAATTPTWQTASA